MTREEFDKKFGHSFFIKHKKWGYQLTNEEANKAGYSVTGGTQAKTTVARSSISISNKTR